MNEGIEVAKMLKGAYESIINDLKVTNEHLRSTNEKIMEENANLHRMICSLTLAKETYCEDEFMHL